MSYICLAANRNGVAVSGDSRLTMEPKMLRLHTDRVQKVFSDPNQGMVWACCGLTLYLGINFFRRTEHILRQSHRSLGSRLGQISTLLCRATKLQHMVTRRTSTFTLLVGCVVNGEVQVHRLDVTNGEAAMKKYPAPVFLQAGWIPTLHQQRPAMSDIAGLSLDQLVTLTRQRCMWAMRRDKQLSQENRKHLQTIGGNVRVASLSTKEDNEWSIPL